MNPSKFSTWREDTLDSNIKICCLQDDGLRCQQNAGNASYSKKLCNTVQQLKLILDKGAGHKYICDYHKNLIQGYRSLKPPIKNEPPSKEVLPTADLKKLHYSTLKRYKKHYKLRTNQNSNKAEMAEEVSNHFKTIPVNEKQILTYFIYKVKTDKDEEKNVNDVKKDGDDLDQKTSSNSDTM